MTPPTFASGALATVGAPDVAAALFRKAERIIAAELGRLDARAQLPSQARADLAATLQRVTLALLNPAITRLGDHAGSVRGEDFATALTTLFALDVGQGEETR
ncbi:hypothetical protein ACWDRB_66550 [Nonomuraea sp. NPDC003707]